VSGDAANAGKPRPTKLTLIHVNRRNLFDNPCADLAELLLVDRPAVPASVLILAVSPLRHEHSSF
jgi:hypothetical protein